MTPFKGTNRVTSPFGPRTSPITGRAEQHRGQDIVSNDGDWNVRECTGGTVIRVTSDKWRGKYVDIQTAPKDFERYQHMDSIAVKVGQVVKQGDIIGVAGNTGDVTGRHLHFGVYRNGSAEANAINPQQWSDVPNKVGSYPGNNNKDNDENPEENPTGNSNLAVYSDIVLSQGDAIKLEKLLNELDVPFTKEPAAI